MLGKVGSGTTCSVFRKDDGVTKVYERCAYTAAITEIVVLSMVHHPNIVSMHSWGMGDKKRFTVDLEYLPHASIELARSIDKLRVAMFQIISACAYLHSRGIAHGDIKFDNIRLDSHWNAKLLDFGNARILRWGPSDIQWDPTTIPFCAPEMAVDGKPFEFASDVWSLGVTWWTLWEHRMPFYDAEIGHDSTAQKLIEWREMDYPIPVALPILRRLLRWNPKERCTFSELLRDPYFAGLDPIQYEAVPIPVIETPIPSNEVVEALANCIHSPLYACLTQTMVHMGGHLPTCVAVVGCVTGGIPDIGSIDINKLHSLLDTHHDIWPTFNIPPQNPWKTGKYLGYPDAIVEEACRCRREHNVHEPICREVVHLLTYIVRNASREFIHAADGQEKLRCLLDMLEWGFPLCTPSTSTYFMDLLKKYAPLAPTLFGEINALYQSTFAS